jgi:hypothetical protein
VTHLTRGRGAIGEHGGDRDKERVMKSNFDEELPLQNDRRRVRAAGPIDWATDDRGEEVVEFKATITQNGVSAEGRRGPFKRGEDTEWWCQADTDDNQRFEPGPATAKGVIVVKTPSGLGEIPWNDEVTLT